MSEYIIRTTNMPEHILEAVSAWYEIDCEIVRCRDCANHTYTQKGSCRCDYWMTFVEPDGFCAWGERRERESAEVWNQWSADDVTCSEES